MMENEIIVPNFFRVGINGDKSIRKNDLGWSESSKRDAQSDYPESIFRYFVEIVGFNILFYYVKDRQFYTIETEKFPIEVRRIFPNPNWDGIIEMEKSGIDGLPSSCSAGDIIALFDDPTKIWDELFIDDTPIGEVIQNSFIMTMD